MATDDQTAALWGRLVDMEPNDIDAGLALYGDALDMFDGTLPQEMIVTLLRKFEDPKEFTKQARELEKERSS